ncbi:hypothetical protein [uncultured Roseivirga sp.]|uniref:hypothetical protein n=1 Tax=uncultured Roseivirga sp. TaxID=543088 RepID=UPI000D7AC633|nr:hypothetical protein [uncultured Roseivirga sp.]PWL31904.1 MAG: hypothetical protein DCO95_01585 [Roseivirga sp. XM-24bin3]
MKRIIIVFGFTSLALIIGACGYNVSNPDDIIVGKYEVISIEISGCDNPNNNFRSSSKDFGCSIEGHYQTCNSITLELTNDRAYILSRNTRTIDKRIGTVLNEQQPLVGYYSFDGDQLKICFNGNCNDARWQLDDNYLHLNIQQANGCTETILAKKR